jgi:acyl-CoA dehydrogenase
MAWESAQPDTDARRALYARLILEYRLGARDPLAVDEGDREREAADILLSDRSASLAEIAGLLES